MSGWKYGVAQFDDPDDPATGWASIDGEAPFKVTCPGDLPSDTKFWTNIGFRRFHNSNLRHSPRVRPVNFVFPSGMERMIDEYALNNPERYGMPVSKSTQLMSSVFSNVMALGRRYYGDQFQMSMPTLLDEFRATLLPADQCVSKDHDTACKAAIQYLTQNEDFDWSGARKDEACLLTLHLPLIEHAQDVLAQPVPEGEWEHIPAARLPPEREKRLGWALNQDRPVLARVVVEGMDAEYHGLLAYSKSSTGDPRRYMGHPELLIYNEYAKLRIEDVFVADHYILPNALTKFPFPVLTGVDFLSVSNQIIAHHHVLSMMRPQSWAVHKVSNADRACSSRCVWMAGYDRQIMFMKAKALQDMGYSVTSYGSALVTVSVPWHLVEEFKLVATELGLGLPRAAIRGVRREIEA